MTVVLILADRAPPPYDLASFSFNIRTDSRSMDTDTADNMGIGSMDSHTHTGQPEGQTRQSQRRSAILHD